MRNAARLIPRVLSRLSGVSVPLLALVAVLGTANGCRQSEHAAPPGEKASPAASGAAEASGEAPAASASPPVATPLAGERIDVPGGVFQAGSFPGDPGRRPELEQRRAQVELGPFRIDRLPYPNDPARTPTVNVTRDAAERLCAAQGTRLCTELEWERACKGPASRLYATGDGWNDRCGKEPYTCASGFDVLAMGALREWTSSDVMPASDGQRKAAVRGALPLSPAPEHRCASRTAESAESASEAVGFRCCKGPKNAALVQEPRAEATFAKATITSARLAELFAKNPKTAPLAKNLRLFRDPDGAETVVARGPGDRKGFLFTVAPLLWNPVPGAEFLAVSGRAAEDTAFVVLFHVLGKDDYLLASTFIMEHEPGPVAFAYSNSIKPRFHFSTCWGCPGETGKVLYRDPDAVVIFQP